MTGFFLNIKTQLQKKKKKHVLPYDFLRMCRSVTHECAIFFFWSISQEFIQDLKRMEGEDCSSVTEFIFLGITNNIVNKVTLFTMVLLVYLINLLANLGMITLIRMDPQLHTPRYFFPSATSPSAVPQPLAPRCWWTYLPRTSQSLSMAVLWYSWFFVPL